MRLVSITTHEPISLDGLRLGQNARITPGEGQFADWRIHVRGPRVILVSPRGWTPTSPKGDDSARDHTMFDIPREKVTLRWSGIESDVDGVAKWSPPHIVQTPAMPPALVSQAAKDKGTTNEGGALASDAAIDAPVEASSEDPKPVPTPKKGRPA